MRRGSGTHEDSNRGGVDALETADIDGLGVIAEPVSKVGSLDQHGGPFLAVQEGDTGEHILDICNTMAVNI